MPTNRQLRTRAIKKPKIDQAEIFFLQHGTSEGGPPIPGHLTWPFFERSCFGENWEEIWREVEEEILTAWIKKNPGTRPWAWWSIDAPEKRARIGGTGETTWEKWPSVFPSFSRGIPSSWQWVDEEDPPTYESEAAYLDRHGLLAPAEKRYLQRHPELLEPEQITLELE